MLIIGALAVLLSGCDENPTKPSQMAYFAAKKFCERYAPSATKFTTETGRDYLDGEATWNTNSTGPGWFATGFVDCQNAQGVMRHQRWAAQVILTDDGNWRATFLKIGGETFVGGN